MTVNRSLERTATIEIQRRQLQAMPENQLRGVADTLLHTAHQQEELLKGAMRRIAELEVKQALMNCATAAAELHPKRQHHLIAYFRRLMGRWRQWRR